MTTKNINGLTLEEFPMYEISLDGRIWSKCKNKWMNPFENVLKHRPNNQYYLRIRLVDKNRKIRKKFIHWLVAKAYILNPENKPFVNHKDGNKQNNTLENLEWVTNKENCIHASKNGLIKKKLTDEQVKEIRSNKFNNWTHQKIADKFNVSRRLIGMIKKGERRIYG